METTRANEISKVEKLFIKSGEIISIRKWHGGNIREIDVHFPNVNFEKWETAKSIKCRVSALHFTDYTPAIWDTQDKICTFFIDTGHKGIGCAWAKNQSKGNPFHYLKIESEKHFPIGRNLIFLGDQTAIGHFCALHQLAKKDIEIDGFINFNEVESAEAFKDNCAWMPLNTTTSYSEIYAKTDSWIINNRYKIEDYIFYIVGNAQLVVSLRKLLKSYGIVGSHIKSKGFW